MVREAQGIEIFGRDAPTIDTSSRESVPRSAALGAGAILLAVLAAVAFAGAVLERSFGEQAANVFTIVALAASALAVLAGLAAVLTGRGRLAGLVAMVLGAAANPWLLGIVLRWLQATVA
jgi:hypothetical protein